MIDKDFVKKRLATLKNKKNKQDSFWKPSPGRTQVRIVPYAYNKENPFIELYFHYNIGTKNYLSPISFGDPDPIAEFSQKLIQSGDRENYKLGKKIEPKMRTFVPVIVRGELDKEKKIKPNTGDDEVKFWGFGKTVYQEILSYLDDPDWGDITDIEKGHDLIVEFKTAEETGKSFPETKITLKPQPSPITDDMDKLKEMISSQKEITEIYKQYSYDELKEVLDSWLNGDESESESESTTNDDDDTDKTPMEEDSDVEVASSKDEAQKKFDELFKGGDK